jgi:predicted neuraminidase
MKIIGLLLPVMLAAGELRVERVFGPETPTGKYKHPSSITEMKNGDLMIVYYGGEGEYAVNTGVFGSKWSRATGQWSAPKMIAHDPFRSVGNGVIWQAPDGLVWLFYVVRWGSTWSTSRIQAKISADAGQTWSDSYVVSEKEGMMVRGRPVVLSTGEYLLPVYHETGFDTEKVGPDTTSRFLRFDAKTKEWKESGVIRSNKGNLQPAVVELDSKHLVAYCRRGGGYGPVKDGYIVRGESNDEGRTWSEGVDTAFPNPNSAVDLIKLASGRVLLVYNDSMSSRTPLRVALSADGLKTWPWQRNVAEGKNDYAYPFVIQTKDGKIHLVFTSDGRTVVRHAVFDEQWVESGK